MGNIFGKPKKSRVTDQDKAVLQLKQQRDRLKQYQKRLENQLEKDRELARSLLKDGKKERAKLLLRKKRYLEQQLNKADGMLTNVEQMTHDIEFKQVEMKVLESLKHGNAALKTIHELFSIEDIENIMDETKEGIEKQKEIDDILHGQLTDEDEEAVLDELNEIILSTIPEPVVTPPSPVLNLPDVPTEQLIDEEKKAAKSKRKKVAVEAS